MDAHEAKEAITNLKTEINLALLNLELPEARNLLASLLKVVEAVEPWFRPHRDINEFTISDALAEILEEACAAIELTTRGTRSMMSQILAMCAQFLCTSMLNLLPTEEIKELKEQIIEDMAIIAAGSRR